MSAARDRLELSPGTRPARGLARETAARAADWQRRFPLLQIVALVAAFAYGTLTLDGFASHFSVNSMLIISAFTALAAAGQTVVILLGGIDFSVPAFISAANVMTAELVGTQGWPFPVTALLICALAIVIGGASGYLSHHFAANPLVVSLGVGSVVAGAVLVWTKGIRTGTTPEWLATFTSPAATTFGLGIPPLVVLWIGLSLVLGVFLHRTLAGRRVYATGSSERAARLALVRTERTWILGFALSGLSSAVVGILLTGFTGSGNFTIGDTYLFPSLAAVIIGGTTLVGARGDYWRTVIGALLLTVLTTVFVGEGLDSADRQILFGLLILVILYAYGRDRRLRDRI